MHSHYRKRRSPRGFTFLGNVETTRLEEKARHAQQILNAEGFERVMPPGIDYPETFSAFENRASFRIRDNQGIDLALRSDVTVQVIKGFCNSLELTDSKEEHRFYYSVPVFRDDKKASLALREIYQVGAELIGTTQDKAIPYLVELSHNILKEAFATEHIILLGDVKAFEITEKYFGHGRLREAVKERNAPLLASIFQERDEEVTANTGELARKLLFAPEDLQSKKAWQSYKNSFEAESEKQKQFLSELQMQWESFPAIMQGLGEKGLPIRWEPLLIRDSDYYTGLLFEAYVPQLPFPPLRGGAYDSLIANYSDQDLPASGLAIDASMLI